MNDEHDQPNQARLVDFTALGGRLSTAAVLLAIVALVGAVVEGLVVGLQFAVLIRWASGYVLALLLTAAVLVALHAFRGADSAQRRGDRLSGRDVGLVPPRRRK